MPITIVFEADFRSVTTPTRVVTPASERVLEKKHVVAQHDSLRTRDGSTGVRAPSWSGSPGVPQFGSPR